MCKKTIKILLIISVLSFNLYSQDIFNDFVKIYNRDGKSYKMSGTFTDIKDGKKKVNDFDMIVGKDYKLMYLKNNNTLFLANNQGFFVQSKGQISPLKISGSYIVTGAANMNDLMSINFIDDYEVEKIVSTEEINLVKKNKSVPYSKAILKKMSGGYTIDFFDNSGKALKRGIYKISNNYFNDMEFYNLIINKNISTVCHVEKIESSSYSSSYFRSDNMKMLFGLFK
ncbi:hypothetical protein OFR22_09805 [Brachyspira hyodysenteriae]|uniref:Uncharacterized protein n=1 Tax=Brachyspira hyodysenteriae ATCC 27164 TaxID=1266923 RepID=A0A3B6VQG0_BRAHO|nr:hypothetical protein [Brachyspira hyodysenteriae]ANN63125.1 hypothetical protein BHYOB78_04380 [Brachyspira hyodysenteriae ATCC 27164]AUJ50546.1 hypothetical protein BH718_02116 [Brachyspira hyodysenteriae]KLI16016.1 hypothetical protein SU45_09005 [Brachyspira hyodysenteriae]KLI16799.1 hypothetical protein SU44_05420 [Brachyspira hyodysenteriae]KLI20636.1 hypothetical protein SU46_02735 [Brachyspira hyodysenteriae]